MKIAVVRSFYLTLCIVLAVGTPVPAAAQNTNLKKRPTIGIVLSGGGARGFAHIGVLKVLEANHIPVDYVGGASMGALIGALYAMGNSPADIEKLVGTLAWNRLLQASVPFDNLSYRRKEDRRNIPAPLVLQGRVSNLKLPNALNSGLEIGLLFDRLTLSYSRVTDFDQLPIPYRAVGTDMTTGESVTLKKGSLSRALRATMAFPGVFSPVIVDDKLLSDGGLVNNIPTDVVKAMGADILIVVNIETQIADRSSLDSLPGILTQAINISTLDNSRRSLRQADIIISPDLGDITLADFSESQKITALGALGAEQKISILKGLALDDSEWERHLALRRSRVLSAPHVVPEYLAVEGDDTERANEIKQKLGDKYLGQPFDEAAQASLSRELSQLAGTGRFETLDFRVTNDLNKKGLTVTSNRLAKREPRPARLELGLDVNSLEADDLNFDFLGRLTILDVAGSGSEWRNDFRVGSNIGLASELYRPLGRSQFFIAPRALYERRRINLFAGDSKIAEYVTQNAAAGVDLGYSVSARSEIRLGIMGGYQSFGKRIGDPSLPNLSGAFSAASFRWNFDAIDKPQVPSRGLISKNTLTYYLKSPGAVDNIFQAETRSSIFYPASDRNTILAFGGGGMSVGGNASPMQQFTLGGPFRLGGYGYEQFRGSNYLQGGIGFLHNPKFLPSVFGGKTYLGAWYEGGGLFEKLSDADYKQSVTGGAIIETPVGPFFFGGAINENGRGRFYFSFGRVFK